MTYPAGLDSSEREIGIVIFLALSVAGSDTSAVRQEKEARSVGRILGFLLGLASEEDALENIPEETPF